MSEPRSFVTLTAAVALFAGAATAQILKGTRAPSFEFQKVWNGGPANFGELEGKLVILDFSQTW
jgi:hypothetical protein